MNSGYGVVTFDFPGHGQSTEFAYVMQPTPELAAVEGVIDWMYDALPWVMREDTRTGIPKDIRVGGSGASYGGAWQILAAQRGGNRLDAIVPMQAWADLNQGLVPNGALNEHWLNLLFAAGTVSATRRDPSFTAWFAESKVINTWPADGRSRFRTASPAFYGSPIRVPTLYIQSAPDTLFNMNHAILNSKMNVGDVKLYTINVEHVGPGATQTTGSTVPCGASTLDDQSRWIDQAIRWYDKYLRGAMADVGSPVDIGLDNGTCIHPDIRALKFPDVVGVNQTFSLSTGPIKISDQPAVFTIPFVSQPQVVGIPRVRFTVESWGLAAPGAPVAEIAPPGCLVPCLPALLEVDNETLVFSLVAASGKGGVTVLDGQSTPIRRQNVVADIVSFDPCPSQPWLAPCALPGLVVEVTPTGYVVSADLAGVASDIAGRVLSLVVQRVHPKYSAERIPGEVVIKDLSVTLPFMDLPPDAIPSRTLETSQPFVADSL